MKEETIKLEQLHFLMKHGWRRHVAYLLIYGHDELITEPEKQVIGVIEPDDRVGMPVTDYSNEQNKNF